MQPGLRERERECVCVCVCGRGVEQRREEKVEGEEEEEEEEEEKKTNKRVERLRKLRHTDTHLANQSLDFILGEPAIAVAVCSCEDALCLFLNLVHGRLLGCLVVT